MRQKVDFNNGTYFAEVRHRIAGRTSLNDVSNCEYFIITLDQMAASILQLKNYLIAKHEK